MSKMYKNSLQKPDALNSTESKKSQPLTNQYLSYIGDPDLGMIWELFAADQNKVLQLDAWKTAPPGDLVYILTRIKVRSRKILSTKYLTIQEWS